jgi:hypothetical protein
MSHCGVREDARWRAWAGDVDKPVTQRILVSWRLRFVAETVEGDTL